MRYAKSIQSALVGAVLVTLLSCTGAMVVKDSWYKIQNTGDNLVR